MSWSTATIYATLNREGQSLMDSVGVPYILLRPPASPIPLIVINGQFPLTGMMESFEAWASGRDVLDADKLRSLVPKEIQNHYHLPDRTVLLKSKWFAHTTKTPVAIYSRETFGGVIESEWSWLFGEGADKAMVVLDRNEWREQAEPSSFFRKRVVQKEVAVPWLYEVTEKNVTDTRLPLDELAMFKRVAAHLGFHAPRGRFMPHERKFNSEPYRVQVLRRGDDAGANEF